MTVQINEFLNGSGKCSGTERRLCPLVSRSRLKHQQSETTWPAVMGGATRIYPPTILERGVRGDTKYHRALNYISITYYILYKQPIILKFIDIIFTYKFHL
jgi:hypothetical protein